MSKQSKRRFSNHEHVTVAVSLIGGDSKAADLEDIAMKVNDLAPGRFTWRKYPSQINLKNVDAFLWDAKKPKNGNFVLNVGRDEWILRVPRKICQLVANLEQAGFVLVPGGKGSHREFRHPRFPRSLILSGQSGDDAHH